MTGPILLTGLATCATCGGGMTLRTGTSKNGTVHRYYTCSNAARAGKAAEVDGRIIRLQGELAEVETRLKRIYSMIEDGIAEMDDILRDRIAGLKIDRERIQTSLDRARTHAVPASDIPPAVVEEFGRMMRENITSGDIPFRKAYIQAVVDQVEDKQVKIIGSKASIHQAMTGSKKFWPGVRSFERNWCTRLDSNQ
ncbi:zinc ribbon domain-containing protein [Rhizobium sp. Root482]|uniref:zinc ribbon domain-containing protein n=1 Tax=Rhizobium sp. Root482 TaxID=1736543 RepID=UPI0009E78660|nr:recombinase zinc beta ribbon domain-containing protein [Rhizobium sp. Root482]